MNNMWLGFAKIHLSNPQDCLDLWEGSNLFHHSLKDKSPVILKLEKAVEIPTKEERLAIFAKNRYLEDTT